MNYNNCDNYLICIGSPDNSLSGCYNDIELIYHLMYHKLNIKKSWKFYQQSYLLIKKVFEEIHNDNHDKDYQLIIYFTGHGYNNGSIRINHQLIFNHQFFQDINQFSNLSFYLTLIFDCCFSKTFFLNNQFGNAKINFIGSSQENQYSSESITDEILFNNLNLKFIKNQNYYIGLFTFLFTKLFINNDLLSTLQHCLFNELIIQNHFYKFY